MDRMLHRLETITAQGQDGRTYTVHGYEHLVRLELYDGMESPWEPTGQSEYRLADGQRLRPDDGGGWVSLDGQLRLQPQH